MALDPQFRTVLDRMAEMGAPPLTAGTADDARRNYRALALARRGGEYRPEAVAAVTDDRLDGPRGPVPVRVYMPEGSEDQPVVDPAMGFPSIRTNGDGYFLTGGDMAWFWHQYVPTPEAGADLEVSLLHAPVPDGLAPAVVVTAEYDPLHDEGVAYAAHLADAGVTVEHVEGDGLIHGFLAFLGVVDAADRCGSRAMAAFARLLRGNS